MYRLVILHPKKDRKQEQWPKVNTIKSRREYHHHRKSSIRCNPSSIVELFCACWTDIAHRQPRRPWVTIMAAVITAAAAGSNGNNINALAQNEPLLGFGLSSSMIRRATINQIKWDYAYEVWPRRRGIVCVCVRKVLLLVSLCNVSTKAVRDEQKDKRICRNFFFFLCSPLPRISQSPTVCPSARYGLNDE